MLGLGAPIISSAAPSCCPLARPWAALAASSTHVPKLAARPAADAAAPVAVVAADTEATETPELARAPARKDWDPRLAAIAEGFVVFTVVTNLVEYVGVDALTEVTAGMVTAL